MSHTHNSPSEYEPPVGRLVGFTRRHPLLSIGLSAAVLVSTMQAYGGTSNTAEKDNQKSSSVCSTIAGPQDTLWTISADTFPPVHEPSDAEIKTAITTVAAMNHEKTNPSFKGTSLSPESHLDEGQPVYFTLHDMCKALLLHGRPVLNKNATNTYVTSVLD